jgi:hypothetical protein
LGTWPLLEPGNADRPKSILGDTNHPEVQKGASSIKFQPVDRFAQSTSHITPEFDCFPKLEVSIDQKRFALLPYLISCFAEIANISGKKKLGVFF